MSENNVRNQSARLVSSRRIAAGMLVTLTLLSAACSDSISRVNAPLVSGSRNALSVAPSSFTVLANAAVTCTDGVISGNVGTASSTGSVTQTTCPIAGDLQVGDEGAREAFGGFLDRYASLTPRTGDVCTTLTGTLDGKRLAPGAYCFDVAATVTGVLTLDGPRDGTWTFKVGTSGTGALTGSGFSVVMAGGGQACNVNWWVADAVTMTGSTVQGNILAGVAITLTGGTLTGQASSRSDVTITGTAVTACGGNQG